MKRVGVVPARGKLEQHPLGEVLRALLTEPRDGCLTLRRGKVHRRLYLRGGMIIYATSTNRRDRLGEVLVAQGKLTREEHREYWEKSQAEQRLLGITLVLDGRITPSDLYQGVMAQMVTILERVRRWHRGDYDFEEGCAPRPGTVLLRIPLALLVHPERVAPPRAPGPGGEPLLISDADLAVPAAREPETRAAAGRAAPAEAEGVVEDPRIGEISFHVQELRQRRGQEPHLFLGAARAADPAAARLGYERIAAALAPEGLPPGLPPELRREAAALLREAAAALQAVLAAAPAGEERALAAQQLPPPPGRTPRPEGPDPRVRRLAIEARQQVKEGDWWEAARSLRQAVRLQPDDAQYRSQLGFVLTQTRRLKEAEEHLLEAIRLDHGNPEHHYRLGLVYKHGRLARKARESFERALRLDSGYRRAREELRDLPAEAAPRKGGGSLLRKLFGG